MNKTTNLKFFNGLIDGAREKLDQLTKIIDHLSKTLQINDAQPANNEELEQLKKYFADVFEGVNRIKNEILPALPLLSQKIDNLNPTSY